MGLLNLPLEMVELICDHVDSASDMGNLRLVCRELDQKIVKAFARRVLPTFNMFTQHRNYKGNPRTYDDLVQVAQHTVFSNAVRHLRIWPSYYANTFSRDHLFGRPEYTEKDTDTTTTAGRHASIERARLEHTNSFIEQQKWIDGGGDVKALGHAFSHLPALTSVTIGCLKDECCDSKHPTVVVRSTGQWLSGKCSIRRRAKGHNMRRNALSYAFLVAIRAVTKATTPVKLLSAGIDRCHKETSDYLQLQAIHEAATLIARNPNSMQTLRTLELMIEIPHTTYLGPDVLTALVSAMPSLSNLRLELWHSSGGKKYCEKSLSHMLANAGLPHLTVLELARATCRGDIFCDFVQRHRDTLKEISLSNFVFRGLNWDTGLRATLESLATDLNKLRLWRVGTEAGILRDDERSAEGYDVCLHFKEGVHCRECSVCRSTCFQTYRMLDIEADKPERLANMSIHGWELSPHR